MRSLVVVIVIASAPAAAEPLKIAREPRDAWAGGPTVVGGITAAGGFGRIQFEALPTLPAFGRSGLVFGLEEGLQYWRDGDATGGGFSYQGVIGVRVPGLRVTVGVGDEIGAVSRMETHFAMAGYALANASIDLWGIRAGIDTRIARYLVVGAPDLTTWQLGISAGYTWPVRHGL
jgi:hypothetical protein